MKTCISCEYWKVSSACGGYSEYTPGWDFSMYCLKNHWTLKLYDDESDTLRKKLETAEYCKDYSRRKIDKG